MIASLRRTHRRIWMALAIVLPLLFALSLYLMETPPVINPTLE